MIIILFEIFLAVFYLSVGFVLGYFWGGIKEARKHYSIVSWSFKTNTKQS